MARPLVGRLRVHLFTRPSFAKPTHTTGNRVCGAGRTQEVSRSGESMVEDLRTVGRGYQCGEATVNSGYRGGGRLHDKPTRKPSTVTPPMSLPDRGWGDGGAGGGGRRRRRRAGASCFSFPDVPEHCAYGDVSSNSSGGVSGCSASSTVTRNTTCISSSSSSSGCSMGIGNGNKSGGGSGGDKVVGCSGESVAFFDLSDGFSSAEEETWGSEGEIEESNAAGRRALVNADGLVSSSLAWRGSVRRIAPPLVARQLDDAQLRLIRAAPLCGSIVAGLRGVNDGNRLAASAAAVIDSRKAAGKRGEASGKGEHDNSGGRASMGRGGICDRGSACGRAGKEGQPWKPAVRLAQPLFIDIEEKASEPIVRADEGAHAGDGTDGERNGKWRMLDGNGGGGDGPPFDDEKLFCGCAEICIMAARGWYRYLAGGVRFSRLLQSSSSPLSQE